MSKRETILETALSLFNDYSYGTVGVDKIIEESNVAKMTFYKYFPSKEMLIDACLTRRKQDMQVAILNELESFPQDDYLGKIKAIYIFYINWFKSDNFNGCIFQKASFEILLQYPSAIHPIKEYRNWLYNLSSSLFSKMAINQPHILCLLYMNILDGITIYSKNNQDFESIEQSWSYIEKLIKLEKNILKYH
ncbi:hypothetical protein F971_03154 [Acinetobacter vivianii]|uniref:HTH tetR-type domain-containing protein n=1 Tax=Acinetobacter vivianii TaxID=1776742 RepID=N8UWW4_9GAMM|nr:TetR/AcrR family transcriptional regulator [Acinetobacter vivianii]ENU92061.1 hypothetical protein F971_03154 [Acinetobacter vivianii]